MGLIDSFADAFGNGLAGGILSIPDAVFGHYENNRNQHFQADEAQKQRTWQTLENNKNRQWQEEMYNQYNSPSAMKRQYQEANYNPYLMMAQGNQGNGMSASPPVGSGAHAAGGSSLPGSSFGSNAMQMIGVNAQAANQQARTVQQEWETYQFIREHVGLDAAKKYLDAHPEMVQSNSPDNDPWMKKYNLSYARETNNYLSEQWEYNLRQQYGIKQADLELNFIKQKTNDLISQMDKRSWDIKEIKGALRLIDEKIRTEKSVQSRNYSEGSLFAARAKTEDESRQYVVRQLLLNTNILEHAENIDRAVFESKESLIGWLSSAEAKEAFARAARNHGLWDADAVRSSFLEFLDHTSGNYFGGFSGSNQSGHRSGTTNYDHDVHGSRSSNLNETY